MGGVLTCTLTIAVTTAAGTVTGTADLVATNGFLSGEVIVVGVGTFDVSGIPCPTTEDIVISVLGTTVTISAA
ncbi:hypothetical protein [Priestia megaterium]|uniref:hypothetical protein n=1 Tax=Priestia megaterium TaxID=1404 RepID=UPI003EE9B7CC